GPDRHRNRNGPQEGIVARRTALVTGASYGVGAAGALALARAGFDVAVTATRAENLKDTLAKLVDTGAKAIPVVLDLRAPDSIAQAFVAVTSAFGALDLLVNNAGTNLRKRAAEVTPAEWDAVFAVNVTGTFLLTQQAGRHWIGGRRPGCVVNLGWTHGLHGADVRSPYGRSHTAIRHARQI